LRKLYIINYINSLYNNGISCNKGDILKELENISQSVVKGELQLFRTMWNNSSDNMFIVEVDKDGELISQSCNRSQEKTFGLLEHQVDGLYLKDILDKKAYSSIASKYKKCISLNKPVTYEESVKLDGDLRYFNTTILPVVDQNGTRIFGVSREITEQKNIEKEKALKEKEKLLLEQAKNIQMYEMIENIAHQWRQPLNVISTASSGMRINK